MMKIKATMYVMKSLGGSQRKIAIHMRTVVVMKAKAIMVMKIMGHMMSMAIS